MLSIREIQELYDLRKPFYTASLQATQADRH